MNVGIIGSGHVGLVTAASLAEIGHAVVSTDNDAEKIRTLQNGGLPIYEPELADLVTRNARAGRLQFATDVAAGVRDAEVVFICVSTPPLPSGEVDLSFVERVTSEVARQMTRYLVVVEKSTVPVRTGGRVRQTLERNNQNGVDFDVVSNPEFLREGRSVYDVMNPDRIVIGADSERAADVMKRLYDPIIRRQHRLVDPALKDAGDVPVIVTDVNSAEIIKHAANSFLALKISYINAIAAICERSGANVDTVADAIGLDPRIGRAFLNAGCGYGGSCLPKDVIGFYSIAKELGYDFRLLQEVIAINQRQRLVLVEKLRQALWVLKDKTIAVLGLSFKPETDDMREAPAIDIIRAIQQEGARVKAYDPQAMPVARALLPDVEFAADPYAAADGADAAVLVTEWPEFAQIDLPRLKQALGHPILIDGRNVFQPDEMKALGFEYHSIGRPS